MGQLMQQYLVQKMQIQATYSSAYPERDLSPLH